MKFFKIIQENVNSYIHKPKIVVEAGNGSIKITINHGHIMAQDDAIATMAIARYLLNVMTEEYDTEDTPFHFSTNGDGEVLFVMEFFNKI